MPEGDTIYRTARTLARALEGRTVTSFETVLANLASVDDHNPVVGRLIEKVRSRGKNLLVSLSGDLHLRTHMRMNGSWHLYRHGERWLAPRAAMRVVIGVGELEAVAFDVPVAEFLTDSQMKRHPDLSRIGPDFLAEDFDEPEAIRRLRAHSTATIAEAILNQRVVAGVGNEYKSEVLFLARVSPFAQVASLEDAELETILRTARRLLQANVLETGRERSVLYRGPRRTTRSLNPAARKWVYSRRGEACRECGSMIMMKKQGLDARVTLWCPLCQQ